MIIAMMFIISFGNTLNNDIIRFHDFEAYEKKVLKAIEEDERNS